MKKRLAAPKVTDLIAYATAILTAFLLVLAVLYWPQITDNTFESRRSSDIRGCLALSGTNVTAARTEFDVARAARDTESTHLELSIAQALVEVGERDRDGLLTVLPQLVAGQDRVRDAEKDVITETIDLRDAQDVHERLTALSIEDGSAFLAECAHFIGEP